VSARSEFAIAHLNLRLRPLHRALRAAVDRQTELANLLTRPDLTPFCVTTEQASVLLDRVDTLAVPHVAASPGVPRTDASIGAPRTDASPGVPCTDAERDAERELRREAAAAGLSLPLDDLAARFGLCQAEQDALLLAAAPELDRAYERIYAYIVDNLNRRLPCVELMVAALATTPPERLAVRRLLGPAARLRRYRLLRPLPGAAVELAQELVLAPGVFDLLIGGAGDAGLVGHDPGEVVAPAPYAAPPQLDDARLARLARALAAGEVDLVGMWGAPPAGQLDAVLALAARADRPLRTLRTGDDDAEMLPERLEAAARTAASLGALLWVPTDGFASEAAVDVLARSRVPTILSGASPWRPVRLLATRAYAELDIPTPNYRQRREIWSAALPDLDDALVEDLAVRYRMSGEELRAVASVAGTGARFAGNGRPAPLADHVGPAVAAVTRGRTTGYAQAVVPRHTVHDLVLPADQFRHIMEVASAFRAWPRVAEAWGFGRRSGDSGVKVLFTGEPGTGKTLSAEVLAGMLGLELLKVDLSQIVSKWVGETEKNLESAFRQAEECQAVLFFDEADSLFGKRGEVKHGTDRYANLEVGYLLQRLESSGALVILASNLRENIDGAFTRRFHFVVNFPRPGPAERGKLWRLAFPPESPLASDVDVDALSRLDMTGAGIVSAARSAALIAADSAGAHISMRDVVAGIARQYQREARLLRAAELGPYASLLGEAVPRRDG
jgi:SpoVK/Ycf46/Vps4 family AAA+-type ATPase